MNFFRTLSDIIIDNFNVKIKINDTLESFYNKLKDSKTLPEILVYIMKDTFPNSKELNISYKFVIFFAIMYLYQDKINCIKSAIIFYIQHHDKKYDCSNSYLQYIMHTNKYNSIIPKITPLIKRISNLEEKYGDFYDFLQNHYTKVELNYLLNYGINKITLHPIILEDIENKFL